MDQQQIWLAVAKEAAYETGRLLREMYAGPRSVSKKGFRDVVTEADPAAQTRIKKIISAAFPTHHFLAEEDEQATLPETDNTPLWIIDPVDGTTNYSRHIPLFTISIALAVGEQVQVGVIYDPLRDELFSAVAGRGVWCNGRPVQVSDIDLLSDAVGAFDWGHEHEQRQAAIDAFNLFARDLTTIRGIGSAALALAWIAAGRLDFYYNSSLKAWDIAAGGLMIDEAGGKLELANGQPWSWQPPDGAPVTAPLGCLGSNGLIHHEIQSRFDTIN